MENNITTDIQLYLSFRHWTFYKNRTVRGCAALLIAIQDDKSSHMMSYCDRIADFLAKSYSLETLDG